MTAAVTSTPTPASGPTGQRQHRSAAARDHGADAPAGASMRDLLASLMADPGDSSPGAAETGDRSTAAAPAADRARQRKSASGDSDDADDDSRAARDRPTTPGAWPEGLAPATAPGDAWSDPAVAETPSAGGAVSDPGLPASATAGTADAVGATPMAGDGGPPRHQAPAPHSGGALAQEPSDCPSGTGKDLTAPGLSAPRRVPADPSSGTATGAAGAGATSIPSTALGAAGAQAPAAGGRSAGELAAGGVATGGGTHGGPTAVASTSQAALQAGSLAALQPASQSSARPARADASPAGLQPVGRSRASKPGGADASRTADAPGIGGDRTAGAVPSPSPAGVALAEIAAPALRSKAAIGGASDARQDDLAAADVAIAAGTDASAIVDAAGTLAALASPVGATGAGVAAAAPGGAPLPTLAMASTPGDAAFGSEFAGRITSLAIAGTREARIRLDPESLGPISIALNLDDDGLSVAIDASHPQTRLAIEQSIETLRHALADNGLRMNDLSLAGGSAQDGGGPASRDGDGATGRGRDGYLPTRPESNAPRDAAPAPGDAGGGAWRAARQPAADGRSRRVDLYA
ncbi:MAG: flagellar hook-length control protein FliK [Lautropia sp.]